MSGKRKTKPVTSREYKMMLKASLFSNFSADDLDEANEFLSDFARAISGLVIEVDGKAIRDEFEKLEKEKQVRVQFFDTASFAIKESGYIYRERARVTDGVRDLTLKFRHPDRFLSSDREASGDAQKFEEDIKADSRYAFQSLYSLSGKREGVSTEPSTPSTVRDLAAIFPEINECGLEGSLHAVGGFTALQTVLEGPKFRISSDPKLNASCALIVWHEDAPGSGSAGTPAVVEFSFRYKDKKIGQSKEPFSAEMADRCFQVMNVLRSEGTPVSRWIDLESPTKTKYVYGRAGEA